MIASIPGSTPIIGARGEEKGTAGMILSAFISVNLRPISEREPGLSHETVQPFALLL